MIVNDIQDDPEAQRMRLVDEAAKIVGRSIDACGREQIHAVVTPAEAPGEFCDGHHFDDCDANLFELFEMTRGACPSALRRESADVHLIQNLARQLDALPGAIVPNERARIDDFRSTVWA